MVTKNQYWKREQQNKQAQNKTLVSVQYAKVVALQSGSPIIQFSGESVPSQKIYPRLKSYVPVVGERVQLINGVIHGSIL